MIETLQEQYHLECASLEDLKKCANLLVKGYQERDQLIKMLMLLPRYPARDAALHLAFMVDQDEVVLLEAIKEIIKTLETSIELKLKHILPYM
ncbi:hypothetical protein QVD17_20947 [Tagetes erecta]|nr:hypothetical protein QVD17_20947 [Tagetes erecta]